MSKPGVLDTREQDDDEAIALLRRLCREYPSCFKPEANAPVPLKIGVDKDIAVALPDVAPAVISRALRLYTGRRVYRTVSAKPGAMRVDLSGHPTSPAMDTGPQKEKRAQTPAPVGIWADLEALRAHLAIIKQEARVKVTIVGRPDTVKVSSAFVALRMRGAVPTTLPKGLPTPRLADAIPWVVLVTTRHWGRVKDALDGDPADKLIIEGYPCLHRGEHVVLAQSCRTMNQQRQQKEAQRLASAGA